MARTFTAPISIGYSLAGTVVATGGAAEPQDPPPGYADGRIPWIEVGRQGLPAAAASTYGLNYPEGMTGSEFNRAIPTSVQAWFHPETAGQVIDSVIHAEGSIGTASIRAMQNGANACNKFPPAIEAPTIGSLTIDALAFGALWSGQVHENDPTALYTQVDSLDILCMRQVSSVWMKEWGTAVIGGSMYGDFHVPEIPADRTLVIGAILGDEHASSLADAPPTDACECSTQPDTDCQRCDWVWNNLDSPYVPNGPLSLPRNPWWPKCDGTPDRRGQVWIADGEGLRGQITINAAVTGLSEERLWSGVVHLGFDDVDATCAGKEISPVPSQPWRAPYYEQPAPSLGGGAVGLVPFHLHGLSCEPPTAAALTDDDHPDQDRTLLNSAFGHIPYGWSFCLDTDPGVEYLPESIVLDFYGPIAAENPDAPPYRIGIVDANGDASFDPDYAQWTAFEIIPGPAGGPDRRLVIHGTVFPQILSGHFRIKPRVSGSARLLCAGLLPGAPSTPVADFDYDFVLDDDCNTNGVPDRLESTGLCCIAWPCDPDFNRDGNADQDDAAYLSNVLAGASNPSHRDPDFNRDGNADQDDLAALVDTLASGNCP